MKRILAVALALCLVTSFVFANGNSESQSKQETITINFWHKDTGVKGELYDKYVAQFEADHPGVDVVVTMARSDAYKEKLPISFSGNSQPDVFFTWGGSWLKSFVDAGHVMELTGKIDTTPYLATALSNAEFNNGLYGIPLGIDIGVVYYNKDIFAKYGLEVPKTFAELDHICEVLKQNGVIPFVLANQPKWPGSFFYMYLADRYGGPEAFQKAYSGEGSWEQESFVKAGETIQYMVKNNWFNPGFNGLTYDSGPGRQLLYTEQCAMMVLSNTFVNLMRSEYPSFEEKMGVFAFPTVEGGKGDPSDIVGIAAPVWSINSNTKYPELCIELVEYLTSQEICQEYANTTGAQSSRKDVKSTDSFVNLLEDMTANAASIQMVYDQTLPAELVDTHLSTTQELFGLTMTPEQAAAEMQKKAVSLR